MKKIAFSFILTLMGVPSLFASEQIVDFAWKATDRAETTEIFTSEDGKIIVRNLGATTPSSRSKLGYTLAIKCSSVELDLSSLNQNIGDLRIAIQNGSSGNVMTQTTEYYNGTEWVFAQTTEYPGNGDILDFPENIVSKGNVERVRFTFDRA